MNRHLAAMGILFGLQGCASSVVDEGTDVLQEAQGLGAEAVCEGNNVGVRGATCIGSYCEIHRIFCDTLPNGITSNQANAVWTGYISEEAPNNQVFCGTVGNVTGAMDGLRVTGWYSDNLSIHCAPITLPSSGYAMGCGWTPYFSEEQGGWASFPVSPPGFAAGIRCSGSFCDNVSYYVCRNVCAQCTSSAQCGTGACFPNGCCGPS